MSYFIKLHNNRIFIFTNRPTLTITGNEKFSVISPNLKSYLKKTQDNNINNCRGQKICSSFFNFLVNWKILSLNFFICVLNKSLTLSDSEFNWNFFQFYCNN